MLDVPYRPVLPFNRLRSLPVDADQYEAQREKSLLLCSGSETV